MSQPARSNGKHPGGRPTEYKPEYCDALKEHCRQGGVLRSFGASVGVSYKTVYNWIDAHEEFLHASEIARDLCFSFYLNAGKIGMMGQLPAKDGKSGTFNASAWKFFMQNISDWREKKDIEVSGKDNGPIAYTNMTPEQVEAELQEIEKLAKQRGFRKAAAKLKTKV